MPCLFFQGIWFPLEKLAGEFIVNVFISNFWFPLVLMSFELLDVGFFLQLTNLEPRMRLSYFARDYAYALTICYIDSNRLWFWPSSTSDFTDNFRDAIDCFSVSRFSSFFSSTLSSFCFCSNSWYSVNKAGSFILFPGFSAELAA